jgi:hypothetical protein
MQAGDPTIPTVFCGMRAYADTAFVSIRVNADSSVGCSRYPAYMRIVGVLATS